MIIKILYSKRGAFKACNVLYQKNANAFFFSLEIGENTARIAEQMSNDRIKNGRYRAVNSSSINMSVIRIFIRRCPRDGNKNMVRPFEN